MKLKFFAAALAAGGTLVLAAAPASAARVVSVINADLSAGAYTFANQGAGFTFGFNGDYFGGGPVTISTMTGGEVNTVFGQPTTNFADGRGGPLSFGPNDQYAAFDTATPIRFTNGGNFIGLRAVTRSGTYYGYAFTDNNVLKTNRLRRPCRYRRDRNPRRARTRQLGDDGRRHGPRRHRHAPPPPKERYRRGVSEEAAVRE